MTEQQYQTVNTVNQQQNSTMGPVARFLLGLFTGAAVAAPVTGLVVKKICDRKLAEEVAQANFLAENRGIIAATEVAQEKIGEYCQQSYINGLNDGRKLQKLAEETDEMLEKAGINEPKKPDVDFGDLFGGEEINDPFFDGIPYQKLAEKVAHSMLKDGISMDTVKKMEEAYKKNRSNLVFCDASDSVLANAWQNSLYNAVSLLKMEAAKQLNAEKSAEKVENAADEAENTQEIGKNGVPFVDKEQLQKEIEARVIEKKSGTPAENVGNSGSDEGGSSGANDAVNGAIPVAVEQPYQPQFTHYTTPSMRKNGRSATGSKGGLNPYFVGEIADPEARAKFEKQMAEQQFPDDEDINNYDLSIDDEEATQEAREFSDSHVEYLEMLKTYQNMHGDVPPMTISREQFDNEHRLEKAYINWYDEDDVFEENNTRIDDPYYTFGYTSGHDMFAPGRTALRDDPDICYVRNLKLSTDYEITRTHGSYTQLVSAGEAYYHDYSDSQH